MEAIYAAATLKSFRTAKLAELIARDAEVARIWAHVEASGVRHDYAIEIGHKHKVVRRDGKVPRPLSSYFGAFNVVVFAPEDLAVVKGSPSERRRFLDRSVFGLDPGYLVTAANYDKVLRSRARVLRDLADGKGNVALLDVYDEQLAALGASVMAARRALMAALVPLFVARFVAVTRTGRVAHARLIETSTDLPTDLSTRRAIDRAAKATTVGPHRDDLEFLLDGVPAAQVASQGQTRAMVLAWKMAELELLGAVRGDLPILLLDDVSSELDDARNDYLFAELTLLAGQSFITTTHPRHVRVVTERADVSMVGGELQRATPPSLR